MERTRAFFERIYETEVASMFQLSPQRQQILDEFNRLQNKEQGRGVWFMFILPLLLLTIGWLALETVFPGLGREATLLVAEALATLSVGYAVLYRRDQRKILSLWQRFQDLYHEEQAAMEGE
ncbi:hypothetical protein HY375_02905 [Candidatus Berkelbacteria bacterium]|nr:hypothetical protein [Candidatus Berkelbacteria bacterium]